MKELLEPPKLVVANRIDGCLYPHERRRLVLESVRFLVVHRVSFAHKDQENPEPIADELLDAKAMVDRQRSRVAIGRCAYHILVRRDGAIEQCLPLAQKGAHCLNANSRSIAVALAGDFRRHSPPAEQLASLLGLCVALLPLCRVVAGHDQMPGGSIDTSKVCPGPRLALPMIEVVAAGRLPADWATWGRAQAVRWARMAGLTAYDDDLTPVG